MIVIGMDVHKHSLTAVAVDEAGRMLDEKTVAAAADELLVWAAELDSERLWALEDCRQLTRWLERQLVAAGEELVRVPPKLMAPERRAGRARGKSDPIDALAVARAAVREPGLGRPRPDEQPFRDLKLLVDHRDDLVDERRRAQQRLRWHLHQLDPSFVVPARRLDRPAHLERVARWLARREQDVQVRVARELVVRCRSLTRTIAELERELEQRTAETAPALLELPAALRYRREAARRSRPDRPLPNRRPTRPSLRCRAARGELRPRPTPPSRPRRQPATQRGLLPDRDHASARPSCRTRLPRTQTGRRQEPTRSDPLPETPARPRRLQHTQNESRLDIGATLAQPSVHRSHASESSQPVVSAEGVNRHRLA
jgi:transposase